MAALLLADAASELWANPIHGIAASLALIVGLVGVAVIVWGVYCAAVRLIGSEMAAAQGQVAKADAPPARQVLLPYLLFGLELLIAGGAIRTLGTSDWQLAAMLGGLVLVRLGLGLSLRWEPALDGPGKSAVPRPALLTAPAAPVAEPAAPVQQPNYVDASVD